MLVVLDIDGTLAAPLGINDLSEWRDQVKLGQVEPLAAAQAVVSELHPAADVVVSTSRPESLRIHTRRWLDAHFPRLAASPLLMRPDGDVQDGWAVKADHLRERRAGRRVLFVDDDAQVRAALMPGDSFVSAPDGWSKVKALLQDDE